MEIKAKLNYLHIAPRKVRLVSDLIKGMDVDEAKVQLRFAPQRISGHLLTLINSAIANAEKSFKLDKEGLYIKQITVDEGTPFKRWEPVSRGRAFPILKRTSSINLVLGIKEGFEAKKKKAAKKETPEPKETKPEKEIEQIKKETKVEKPKPTRVQQEAKKPSKFKGFTQKIFRRKSF